MYSTAKWYGSDGIHSRVPRVTQPHALTSWPINSGNLINFCNAQCFQGFI